MYTESSENRKIEKKLFIKDTKSCFADDGKLEDGKTLLLKLRKLALEHTILDLSRVKVN